MQVLVVGGTGFIGTELCRELDERGHDVTALSRTPGDAELPEGVESVSGDVTAYDSIEGAFEGQDAVVNLVALSPLFKTPRGVSHESVHLGGTENVVEAAQSHGVERIVQMSGVFADPEGPTAYLRAKGQAEAVVRESDLEWVILRPTVVFGDGAEFRSFVKLVTTPFVTGLPGGGKALYQPIWVGDMVEVLADCVEDDDHVGETYELGGPERLSLADVTRMIYRADGRSIRIVPVPTVLAKIGLRLANPLPFVPLGADQGKSLDMDLVVEDNDVDAFGMDPGEMRTYGEYLGVA